MFSDADRAVMKENYRNSRMGREAINVMISKVEDDDLALDLNRQACKFMQFEEKIQKEYMKAEEPLPEENLVGKTMLWGGIVDLMKAVKSNQSVQKEYYEIAQELMDFEEKNIEKLKAYLR